MSCVLSLIKEATFSFAGCCLLNLALAFSTGSEIRLNFTRNKRRKCYEKYAIARSKCTLKSYSLVSDELSASIFLTRFFSSSCLFPSFRFFFCCCCSSVHVPNLCENIYLFSLHFFSIFCDSQRLPARDPLYLLFAPFASASAGKLVSFVLRRVQF